MSSLHPIFAGILAAHGITGTPTPIRRADYVSALRRMDWQFEHSDDHGVWKRGRAELERLRFEQRELDPDGSIWRANAPAEFPPEVQA